MTHLSRKHSSVSVRAFRNCTCNLKCLFLQSHTSARPPLCEHTCQHVSFRTCHSWPFYYANLCCQQARCTSQSTQRARSGCHAALQTLQISKLLCRSTFLEPGPWRQRLTKEDRKQKRRRARHCVHITGCTC